jgi:hypothetical protein
MARHQVGTDDDEAFSRARKPVGPLQGSHCRGATFKFKSKVEDAVAAAVDHGVTKRRDASIIEGGQL